MPTTGKPVLSVSGGWLTILLLSVTVVFLLSFLSFEGLVASFLCVVITVSVQINVGISLLLRCRSAMATKSSKPSRNALTKSGSKCLPLSAAIISRALL